MEMNDLWLDPIPPESWEEALACLEEGDAAGFLFLASNADGLSLVVGNTPVLLERGIYEAALLHAFVYPAMNNSGYSLWEIASIFAIADRTKLRAAGDALPGSGPFTIYRGVSGRGRFRRIRGFSWTADFKLAKWFATRFYDSRDASRFADPEVFRTVVEEKNVLAYLNQQSGRNEQEFVIEPPKGRLVRAWRLAEEPNQEQELERIREFVRQKRLANKEKMRASCRSEDDSHGVR